MRDPPEWKDDPVGIDNSNGQTRIRRVLVDIKPPAIVTTPVSAQVPRIRSEDTHIPMHSFVIAGSGSTPRDRDSVFCITSTGVSYDLIGNDATS